MSAPPRSGWRSRARAVLTERLGLKAIALLIAALLWVVVGARQPTEGYMTVRVAPQLDSSLVLLDGTRELKALVAGRAADLVKLYATPLTIRRAIDGDVPDTLVLDVVPSDVRVPPELAELVHVVDVQPRNVMLRFETRATRRVAVVNEGRVMAQSDSGAAPTTSVEFEPRWVRVTGPRRTVRRLGGIRPYSLSIAMSDTMPHVADLDTSGMGVRVQPAQVKVRLVTARAAAAASVAAP